MTEAKQPFPAGEIDFLHYEMGDVVGVPKNPNQDSLFGIELKDGKNAADNIKESAAGERLSTLDKLRVVYGEYGFFPTTQTELTDVWEIRKYRDDVAPIGTFLNRILQRQQRSDVRSLEPQKALRSKVSKWTEWLNSTRADASAVDYLQQTNNGKNLSDQDMMRDSSYSRGHDLIRLIDYIAKSFDIGESKKPYQEAQSHDINNLLGANLKERVWQASVSTESRQNFWLEVIAGAKSHLVTRAMAAEAIKNFVR